MKIKHAIFTLFLFLHPAAFGQSTDRYVLVAGFLNETMVGYFKDNVSALKKNGVTEDHILVVKPPSKNSIEKNSEFLGSQLQQFISRGPEPLVIIAHSKGANEVLIWALQNPEFVRDHVRAIFMVQGAFGGSRLADFIEHKGHPVDKNMPEKYRIIFRILELEGRHEGQVSHDGLQSLSSEATTKLWPTLMAQKPPALSLIDRKIFYILGSEDVPHLPLMTKALGSYLTTYYGKNDGVVLVQDQVVQGIGHVLLSTTVDHMGWFLPRPEGSIPGSQRKAFTNILYNYALGLEL
jgi:predicted alpha/beta hydrolase family esterase